MSAGTCSLEIEFTLKPGKRREFAQSFGELVGHEVDGQIKSTVFEDREEPEHMVWVARWKSRQTLEKFMKGKQFAILVGGLKVLSVSTVCQLIDEERDAPATEAVHARHVPRESRFSEVDLALTDVQNAKESFK
jgi:quinol monooxygenase YgiN